MLKKIKKGMLVAMSAFAISAISVPVITSSLSSTYAATKYSVPYLESMRILEEWADNNNKNVQVIDLEELDVKTKAEADEFIGYMKADVDQQYKDKTDNVMLYIAQIIYVDNLFKRTIKHVDENGKALTGENAKADVVQTGGTKYSGKKTEIIYNNMYDYQMKDTAGNTTVVAWDAYTPAKTKDYEPTTTSIAKVASPSADTTVTIKYKRSNRTVTFNGNGSTGGSTAAQTVQSGVATALKANGFTRTGYTFAGWNTKADGSGTTYKAGANITTSTNTTLYAQWTPNVLTIKYYPGKATGDSNNKWDGKASPMQTINYYYDGTTFASAGLPNANGGTWKLTKDGYAPTANFLIGSATSTNKISQDTKYAKVQDLAKAAGLDLTKGNQTLNLYAEMLPVDYTITYTLNGGTNNSANPAKYNIETSTITLKDPTKTGYTFIGWKEGKTINKGSTGNKTFTAQWTANAHTITYKANGGTGNDVVQNTTYDAKPTIKANPFSKNGYTFAGWATTASGNVDSNYPANAVSKKAITGNLTLYAKWTPITYKITYNLNGGTNNSGNPATYTIESAAITLKAPTKNGYTGSWKETATIAKGSTGNKTFNAQYTPINYTITYNLDGGINNSANPKTYTVESAAITLKNPTKTGYTFNGWKEGSTIAKGSTGNKTFTAQWTANKYTVTFVDGAGKTLSTQTIEHGKAATAPANPTRTGYTFAGWDKTYNSITGNTTITAKWNTNKYTVTFIDGQGKILKTESVEHGKAATAPTNPTRTGYVFAGWDKALTNITGNTTITAKWNQTFTVTFVDGTGKTLKTQTVENGKAATAPANPTRSGYVFTGWDKSFDKITANTTVTAKWNQTFTVTFVDGTGKTLKIETVEKGKNATAPANPTRTGYKFTGWDKALTNITANTTITAKWEVLKYTVTFTDGQGKNISTQTIEYGKNATAPANPTTNGAEFDGWDKGYTNIKANTTVNAKWKDLIPGGWYTISTTNPLFRLGTPDSNDDVRVQTSTNKSGQKFKIQKLSDGNYRIGTGTTVGTKVLSADGDQIKYNASDNSCKWKAVKINDTTFNLQNVQTGKYLTYSKAGNEIELSESATNSTNNQKFIIKTFNEKFTVTFLDGDGNPYVRQSVVKGGNAVAPTTNPKKAGKAFAGWDKSLNNITGNVTISPVWK